MLLTKLAFSDFRHHKVRVALTVAAITLAVSLVVSVTTGYASLREAVFQFINQYIGSVDAFVRPSQESRGIAPAILEQLAADPQVQSAIPRLDTEVPIISGQSPISRRLAQVKGIRRPDDREVEKLPLLAGDWFDTDDDQVAVIDQVAAEIFGIRQDGDQYAIGQSFTLPGFERTLSLRVVGVVRKPSFLAQQNPAIYVPLRTLQRFTHPDNPDYLNRVLVMLKTGSDARAFERRWEPKLAKIDPNLRLRLASDTRIEAARNMRGLELLSYLGGAVALLAATFIVFSSLSMGVTERARILAMLRAVGALRGQLARLVLLEGLSLALLGVVIGVPLGILWVRLLSLKFPLFFGGGITIGWGGVLFGSVGTILAALAAALLPAWMAMRTDPLSAMAPLAEARPDRFPLVATLAGVLLASLDSLILMGPLDAVSHVLGLAPEVGRQAKLFAHFLVGVPGIMIGFFLLAPAFVWIVERMLGPVVALLLGVRYSLLRQQLTGGIWRAAGTAAALMVGLAVLVVMQTQGNTMLGGWRLPTRFPDVFISSPSQPLTRDDVAKLAEVPGIRDGEIMPLAIASPRFGSGWGAILAMGIFPDATMFFGVDPDLAFELMELDFRDNDGNKVSPERRAELEAQARQMLKKGKHLIITEEFRALQGLKVGDPFPLRTSERGEVDYIVAGIVWSPGLDVIVGMYDLDRTFEQRTASSVFGTLDDAREDFGATEYRLLVANLDYGVEREDILDQVKATLGERGLLAYDIRHIKYTIEHTFRQLLMLMSTVALAALTVASLGVTNTVMAAVRSRRWQFGVLRSIGVTRLQLLRLVLAEAILLGLVGVTLGVTTGLTMSINAKALAAGILGYNPPLDVPWGIVGIGAAAVMLIALLASLWPAIHVARAQPLSLLQAGRAAA